MNTLIKCALRLVVIKVVSGRIDITVNLYVMKQHLMLSVQPVYVYMYCDAVCGNLNNRAARIIT